MWWGGVRKIKFLKVRTLLRGTVKSVTNVWKIKKNETLYLCTRVYVYICVCGERRRVKKIHKKIRFV